MSPQIEFSRRLPLHRLGRDVLTETVEANAQECDALARRMSLLAVANFRCRWRLTPEDKGRVLAEGWLSAEVTQTCVVTAEPFDDLIVEEFALRFVPRAQFVEDDALDLEAIDELPYDGNALDLGEAAAEQLALALPPFPRRAGAALEQGVDVVPSEIEEEEKTRPNPFAALAGRKGNGT
ncbi:YceD family protein [Brytella acorum]|uniref:DUF177 domain-containing protein n=1 Tax=Brytella acorum TaxID=2959299 RepID=A0AA35UG76_9PROT|nr:DUF177 domain-containing protein [Brytella acorum]MDF3624150.1 DUF177 domain-containing protein [Brytella acorum]CAI9120656.1 DUF177 domain-containing protein [Brytella acorum]